MEKQNRRKRWWEWVSGIISYEKSPYKIKLLYLIEDP